MVPWCERCMSTTDVRFWAAGEEGVIGFNLCAICAAERPWVHPSDRPPLGPNNADHQGGRAPWRCATGSLP